MPCRNYSWVKTMNALKNHIEKSYKKQLITEEQHRELNNMIICDLPMRLIIEKCKEYKLI